MTRQQFRLLVVLYQFVAFGLLIVSELPEQFLPPEMGNGYDQSVLDAPGSSFFDDIPQMIYYATTFLNVVASIGLCFGKKWGRSLFVGCALALLLSLWLGDGYYSGGWSSALNYVASLLEGMIIALIYFSHLRRMFNEHQESGDAASVV